MIHRLACASVIGALVIAGCAPKKPTTTPTAAQFPDFVFPASFVSAAQGQAERQRDAWNALQSGNIGAADKQLNRLLQRAPSDASLVAGLGYVSLARHDLSQALARFDQAVTLQPSFASALVGKGLTLVELGRAGDAIGAFEAAQKSNPALELTARIEALRFRAVDESISLARTAAAAGRTDEARAAYAQALSASPDSPLLLRELALVERRSGDIEQARVHLERAATVDPHDRATQVALAELFEAQADYDRALRGYDAAQAIEATPDIEARRAAVRERVDLAQLPAEFRAIATRSTATRGDLAALIGIRLPALLRGAAPRPPSVVTDTRNHWASRWIAPVLRAGVMEPYPNHTFQPRDEIRRLDLAVTVARVLDLISTQEPTRAARWLDKTVTLADLPSTHPAFKDVSRAVAAGVLDAPNRTFDPTRLVTGSETQEAVVRLERLAGTPARGAAQR
jgi:tetratricopeptide (TPR) repeat protein